MKMVYGRQDTYQALLTIREERRARAEERGEMTDRELDLDKVVAEIRAAGFDAYVEQTGGGTATIYAGTEYDNTDGPGWETAYPVIAGPGWFAGPNWTDPRAHAADFSIGPDDGGEAEPFFTPADWTEAQVAEKMIADLRAFDAKKEAK